MALGKTNRIEGKAYFLKLKLKDGERFLDVPVFDVTEKIDGKYVPVQKVEDVNGDLIKINTRLGEFEGSPIRNVTLVLKDRKKGEVYYVDFGLGSGLGRGLANSVLSLKEFVNVQIGLYGQKSKKDGKTYPAVSVRQGSSDETIKWAHDPKDGILPAFREFKGKGGKLEKDWTETEEFLFDEIKTFADTIPADEADSTEAAPAQSASAEDIAAGEQEAAATPAPAQKVTTPAKPAVPAKPVSGVKSVQGAKPVVTGGKVAPKPVATPPLADDPNESDMVPF